MSDRITWTAARIARAATLWGEGLTAAAIAAALGCPRNAIVGLADRHRDRFPKRRNGGVVAPPSGSPAAASGTTEARLELVAPLWRSGLSVTEIVQRTGLTRNQVNWLVRQHPDLLPPRRRGFAAATHPAKLKAARAARKELSAPSVSFSGSLTGTDSFAPSLSFASRADGDPGAPASGLPLKGGADNDPPAKAEAFRPLKGSTPALLWQAKGCHWPVHVDGSDPMRSATLFVCNAGVPISAERSEKLKDGAGNFASIPCSYCATHAALANGEESWAERRAIRDARRAA